MTKSEAMTAMREGKKVTHENWFDGEWATASTDEYGAIVETNNGPTYISFDEWLARLSAAPAWDEGWSLYEEPKAQQP